ncbi:polysaccharide deacetylase family protein [Natronolimnohabitans innermongolicus]|uniref:Polysaccharide deacetylase n=1 Tax=Natronolimnohabitans innermongolicus JCM 12255 TaxID=1227499 RepID=L9WXV8_9EURY|nr:polysaccharide deacetylase family protein [Natronolimnohabitans innermongolicus]ELY54252.1 polysaccharide deacetylase [Natronolimnohabitans innermongolicus JCM 12255]
MTGRELGRRDVCRLGATSALAMAGLGAGTGTVVGDSRPTTNGQIVFIYDDSWREDWTDTFPVHQEEDVPACCAAVVDYVDTSWGLLPEHLREMEADGWEIMSHTASHVAVGNLYLTAPAEPGDERLALDGSFLGDHEGDPIVVSDGDRTVENAVAGGDRDDDGIYLDLEEPIDEAFDAGTAFARFTDERVRDEVVGSKEALESMGVDVDAFVSPFGRSDGLVDDLVREHYAAFANRGGNGLNSLAGLDSYELGRSSIDGNAVSEPEIETFYDDVAASDTLGIVVGHSQFDETTPERVRFAIREAKARDLEIVTLREALREHDAWPASEGGESAGDGDGAEGDADGSESTGTEAETESESDDGDGLASTVRDNRTPILAGTGLATAGLAGTALYRRRQREDENRL